VATDHSIQIRAALESYRSDPALTVVLTEPFIRRMEIFGTALALWGARINLTARPEDPTETAFHVADSLIPLTLAGYKRSPSATRGSPLSPLPHSVVGEVEGEGSDTLQALSKVFTADNHILDLGAGAGFPGLVLASACPARFTLAEARLKRASFLKVAAAEMALDNVEILVSRLTVAGLTSRFDAVVARASGPAASFYDIAAAGLSAGGCAILYANPSQRLDLAAAKKAGLRGYRRYEYSLRRGSIKVDRVLAIWRAAEKKPSI
jgi:16S rRNA G527 N7-methylase RsmG